MGLTTESKPVKTTVRIIELLVRAVIKARKENTSAIGAVRTVLLNELRAELTPDSFTVEEIQAALPENWAEGFTLVEALRRNRGQYPEL